MLIGLSTSYRGVLLSPVGWLQPGQRQNRDRLFRTSCYSLRVPRLDTGRKLILQLCFAQTRRFVARCRFRHLFSPYPYIRVRAELRSLPGRLETPYTLRSWYIRFMSQAVNLSTFQCWRCGHIWYPRKPEPPRCCGRCKSPYWDKPRKNEPPQPSEPDEAGRVLVPFDE